MKQNKFLSLIAATSLYMFSSALIAGGAGQSYMGIQYALGNYSEEGISQEADPSVLVGRYGTYLQNNFSIEGRLGIGIAGDTLVFSGIEVDVEVDYMVGIYALGHMNIAKGSSVYGLIGFTQAELTASAFGLSATNDDSGVSFGVGANIGSFNIEYIQYLDESEYEFSALSFGYITHF